MRGTGLIAIALAAGFALPGCGPLMGATDDSGSIPCGSGGPANCIPAGLAMSGGTADAQGWTRHEVVDQSGFERPMTAFSLPVPPGWRAQSEMVWSGNGRCAAGNPSAMIRMTSADGRAQIEYLHGFLASNYSDVFRARGMTATDQCVLGTVTSGEQMVREVVVPRLRQGWQMESITPVQLPAPVQQIVQASRGGGPQVEGYAFHILLASPDGTQVEQMYVAGMVSTVDAMGTGVAPPVQNMVGLLWAARGTRDSVPQLFQVGEQIRAALQYNPDWQERMNRHNKKIQDYNSPNYRSPAPPTTAPVGPNTPNEGIHSDPAQRRRIDGIREVERCYDPETGVVYEVSIHVGCR